MKTQKDTMKTKKIKILIPARNPAKLADSMSCCKPHSPSAVESV